MFRILIPVLVLIGALGVSVLSDRPQPRADFVFINNGSDANTLDPQRMSWMPDLRLARALYEPLVLNDVFSPGFDIIPGAAERWEVSDDRLTYTFHIRPDARWSNGEPVRSTDFVYAWRRALLPDVGSKYVNFFWMIDGAEAFYQWRLDALEDLRQHGTVGGAPAQTAEPGLELWRLTGRRFEETVGLHTPDERTLVVRLHRPVPYFLDICAFAVFSPVYPELVREYERVDPASGRLELELGWTKPPRLVSNGAFRLDMWRFKRDMRFVKNEHYWNRDEVAIDSMTVLVVEDPNAQVLAFNSGAAEWMSSVTASYRGDMYQQKLAFYAEHADEVARLRAQGLDPIEIDRRLPDDPRNHIHAFPAFGTYFYNFNCSDRLPDGRPNPFADARVRRAFALAIDKERIVRDLRRVGEPVATTLIPPGSIGGYEAPEGLARDPDEARRLLAEAGYPGGQGFLTVEMLFNKDAGHDVIAQAIARDWETELGVSVSLAQKELKTYRNDMKENNFMVARAGWYGDYGDPMTFLEINQSANGNNDRDFASERYDALLARAEIEQDTAERVRLLHEAERLIVEEELPLVPIFHYANVYMFNAHKISGINSHPRTQQNVFLIDRVDDDKGPNVPRAQPPAAGSGEPERGDGAS